MAKAVIPSTFRRTAKQRAMVAVNLALVAALATWSLWAGLDAGRTGFVILGALAALWACFIGANLVRRETLGAISEDGLYLRGVLGDTHIAWDRMEWADIPKDGNGAIIGHRPAGSERTRMAAFSQRLLGPEAVAAIRTAIDARRPDLPQGPPHEKVKT